MWLIIISTEGQCSEYNEDYLWRVLFGCFDRSTYVIQSEFPFAFQMHRISAQNAPRKSEVHF